MPTPNLLPCPFCPDGGTPFADAYVHAWEIVGRVGCRECGVGFDAYDLTGMGRDAQADADALLPPLVEKWNRRATLPPQPKTRRDRRKCDHFRFPTVEIAHVWCAKYGPHYECLGASGCTNYRETDAPVMQGRAGGRP